MYCVHCELHGASVPVELDGGRTGYVHQACSDAYSRKILTLPHQGDVRAADPTSKRAAQTRQNQK